MNVQFELCDTDEDCAAAYALLVEAYEERGLTAMPYDEFTKSYESYQLVVGKVQGEVVVMCGFCLGLDGVVRNVNSGIAKAYRRQGITDALGDWIVPVWKERGAKYSEIWVLADDEADNNFWRNKRQIEWHGTVKAGDRLYHIYRRRY